MRIEQTPTQRYTWSNKQEFEIVIVKSAKIIMRQKLLLLHSSWVACLFLNFQKCLFSTVSHSFLKWYEIEGGKNERVVFLDIPQHNNLKQLRNTIYLCSESSFLSYCVEKENKKYLLLFLHYNYDFL